MRSVLSIRYSTLDLSCAKDVPCGASPQSSQRSRLLRVIGGGTSSLPARLRRDGGTSPLQTTPRVTVGIGIGYRIPMGEVVAPRPPLWSFVICHLSHYFSDVVSEKSAGRVGVGGRDSRGVTQCSDPKGRNDSPGSNQKVIRTRRLGQGKGRWSRASIDPCSSLVYSVARRVNSAIRERGLRRSATRNYSAPVVTHCSIDPSTLPHLQANRICSSSDTRA